MKKRTLFKHAMIALIAMTLTTLLHADETQPKFTIIPSTQTKWVIPSNGNATVIYTVTNQTKITRTLTMKPIAGITQNTTGSGVCGSTFTLAHGQSCQLVLPLVGSQLSGHITEGPVICKTKGRGDNGPDPFLCSQPSRANSLDITSVGVEQANVTVSPSSLSLQVNSGQSDTLTVTNNSTTVTVENITLNSLPSSWTGASPPITLTTTCSSLAPAAQCTVTIATSTLQQVVQVPIPSHAPLLLNGTNMSQVSAMAKLTLGRASISVDKTSVLLYDVGNASKFVTVTNTSPSVTANGITAALPTSPTFFEYIAVGYGAEPTAPPSPPTPVPPPVPSSCPPLGPSDTCIIYFRPGEVQYTPPELINIEGSNTNPLSVSISVEATGSQATITATPSSLAFIHNSTIPQCVTVKNTSTSPVPLNTGAITTTLISDTLVAGSSCPSSTPTIPLCTAVATLTPGQSCNMSYLPQMGGNITGSPPPTVTISGATASPVLVTIEVKPTKISLSHTTTLLAQQGIFVAQSGGGTANGSTAVSKTRHFNIINDSAGATGAITTVITQSHPTNFSITTNPTDCLSAGISPSGTCSINIIPGITHTTPVGLNNITPDTITFSGSGINTQTEKVIVLTYGNYYSDGFVYAIDDTTPVDGSAGGSVYQIPTVPAPGTLPWDPCPAGGCQTGVLTTPFSEGNHDTNLIYDALQPTTEAENYAAGYCLTKMSPIYPAPYNWYLPAVCQVYPFTTYVPVGGTGSVCMFPLPPQNPQFQYVYYLNTLHLSSPNIPEPFQENDQYWTSAMGNNSFFAFMFLNEASGVSIAPAPKDDSQYFVCAHDFQPPT